MFFANLFKLIFFMIAIYFFYSVFRMLMFSARHSRENDERMRMEARERMKAKGRRGRTAKGDEVIELDKNQYKVE